MIYQYTNNLDFFYSREFVKKFVSFSRNAEFLNTRNAKKIHEMERVKFDRLKTSLSPEQCRRKGIGNEMRIFMRIRPCYLLTALYPST